MPLNKDDSGRRWVEMEFLVPGTPEQVWHAIATGPGMSAWFTPTTVEEKVGGAITFHFGVSGRHPRRAIGLGAGSGSARGRGAAGVEEVTEALGIAGADVGDRCETQSGAPRLTGVVRRIHQDDNAREVMLRVDEPAPGVAIVGACTVAGQARVMATVYLYGDAAADVAAAEQPKWSEWLRGVLDTAGAAT